MSAAEFGVGDVVPLGSEHIAQAAVFGEEIAGDVVLKLAGLQVERTGSFGDFTNSLVSGPSGVTSTVGGSKQPGKYQNAPDCEITLPKTSEC